MATPSDDSDQGQLVGDFRRPAAQRAGRAGRTSITRTSSRRKRSSGRRGPSWPRNRANYYPTIGVVPVDHADSTLGRTRAGWRAPARPFPCRDGELGAGSVGPGASVGRECGGNAQVSAADLENLRLSAAGAARHRLLFAGRAGHAAGACCTTPSTPTRRTSSSPPIATTAASRPGATLRWRKPSSRAPGPQSTETRVARAQFEHAIATLTGQPPAALRYRREQDRRPAAADSGRGSLAAARAASGHCGE